MTDPSNPPLATMLIGIPSSQVLLLCQILPLTLLIMQLVLYLFGLVWFEFCFNPVCKAMICKLFFQLAETSVKWPTNAPLEVTLNKGTFQPTWKLYSVYLHKTKTLINKTVSFGTLCFTEGHIIKKFPPQNRNYWCVSYICRFQRKSTFTQLVLDKNSFLIFLVFTSYVSKSTPFTSAQLTDHIKPWQADVYLWFPWWWKLLFLTSFSTSNYVRILFFSF